MSDLGLNRKPVLLEDKAAVGPRQYCGIHNAEHAVRVQIRCWNVPGRSTSRSIDSENDSHISDVNPFRICRVSVLRQDAVRLIIVRIDSQTAPRGTEVTAMNRINLKLDPIQQSSVRPKAQSQGSLFGNAQKSSVNKTTANV